MHWTTDSAHTIVEFSAKHLGIFTVRGRFRTVRGEAEFDPSTPTSASGRVEIDAASLDTGDAQRDTHLRSADFLDVENHPLITFVTRSIEHQGGDRYRVIGDATIRGTTRPLELEATYGGVITDPWGAQRAAVEGRTSLNRSDFGLKWNMVLEAGRLLVGETVTITAEAELVAKQEAVSG